MKKKWIALYFLFLLLPYLVVLLLGKLGYFNPKEELQPTEKGYTVCLYHHQTKTTEELPLKEYLWGVLAGEMPASYPTEALKAQVVASYSYLLHRKDSIAAHPDADFGHEGDICDNPAHCKAYLSPAEAKDRWGEEWFADAEPILKEAVEAVLGQAVFYDGAPANTVFHSISGGYTEDAADVWGAKIPYLISVCSEWDRQAEGFASTVSVPLEKFCQTLGIAEPTIGEITPSEGGSVKSITLGDKEFSGPQIRTFFELRSTRFTLSIDKEKAVFKVEGYGHQVGMSQYGASVLARNGYDHREILAYYYPGTTLQEYFFDE